MTLAEDVAALQGRIAEAQRDRARAEGSHAAATAALERAREELIKQFNVDTTEAAERLLNEMRAELIYLVEQITAKLDKIGA